MALQLEAGLGRAMQLLEHSHLSADTGTEGKEDSWHLCWAGQSCHELRSSPLSSRLSRNSTKRKCHVPRRGSTCQFNLLRGHLTF